MKYLSFILIFFTVLTIHAIPPYVGDGKSRINFWIEKEVDNTSKNKIIVSKINRSTLKKSILKSSKIKISTVEKTMLNKSSIFDTINKTNTTIKGIESLVFDKRNVFWNSGFTKDELEIYKQWIEIYKQNWELPITGSLPTNMKMIAEIRMPQDKSQAEILEKNLNIRKNQGFDSVLVTFDGSENPEDLATLANYLKVDCGWKVWFAFGGKDDLNVKTYLYPEDLKKQLYYLGKICDGYLSHWRRTSSHLFIQDQVYMDFLAQCVKLANPQIPVLGEIYFGETYESNETPQWIQHWGYSELGYKQSFVWRKPTCANGWLIVNLGGPRINLEGIKTTILDKDKLPKAVLLTGPGINYLSSNKLIFSREIIQNSINKQMGKWKKLGINLFIVTHGDGNETAMSSDNLSTTLY